VCNFLCKPGILDTFLPQINSHSTKLKCIRFRVTPGESVPENRGLCDQHYTACTSATIHTALLENLESIKQHYMRSEKH